jgi:hypothetical protein
MNNNSTPARDISMADIEKNKKHHQEMMKKKQEEILKQMILMVTRQTEYSFEEAESKLKENNYNYDIVIKEYMGIPIKKESAPHKSTNQAIYSEIRNLMDDAASTYRQQQEMTEARNKYIEQYKQMIQQQQQQQAKTDSNK